ncbi:uncharacterized protein LOC100159796 [Acyrthosiphon pisum]|uniref:Regulatory protein zeste n=1 Tax=Acyrthosiphon pisum TaxID=7029 RepID=A0A8R2JRV2_ACYPI|nr:uncharacterized protein LOC100159796 [Acyrthosiphon pisum]
MAKWRPTKLQMKPLIELVSNDQQLIAGKLSSNCTYKIMKERWKQIDDELNALPGAEKSSDKWKKFETDDATGIAFALLPLITYNTYVYIYIC